MLYYRHEWRGYETLFPSNTLAGDATTLALLFAPKQYIKITPWFRPYNGVGIGIAFPTVGGGAKYDSATLISQEVIGVDFQFGKVGVVVEYKAVKDQLYNSANGDVRISGGGVFGGMSIRF